MVGIFVSLSVCGSSATQSPLSEQERCQFVCIQPETEIETKVPLLLLLGGIRIGNCERHGKSREDRNLQLQLSRPDVGFLVEAFSVLQHPLVAARKREGDRAFVHRRGYERTATELPFKGHAEQSVA